MKRFKEFIVKGYTFDADSGEARFMYSFDNEVHFEETLFFAVPDKLRFDDSPSLEGALLFDLTLALGVSYYKLFPTSSIQIEQGGLTPSQETFWQDFYCLGLGEFSFENGLDPIRPLFVSSLGADIVNDLPIKKKRSGTGKHLLCRGGGKDSLVSAAILKKNNALFDIWTFGRDYAIHRDTGDILGVDRFVIKRSLSKQLMTMVKEGYYNGHAPITGMIHFVAQFVAYLYGYEGVVFSNERSANFGNTEWRGITINHQWSKSYDFERALHNYRVAKYPAVAPSFSLLRQWNEVRIAQEFAQLIDFFEAFSSCNRNFHIDGRDSSRWCCTCPKCAFVYGALRPFLSVEDVQAIRGKELYEDISLLPLFKELRGVSGIKPLECVGTYDEMQYATWLYLQDNPSMTEILSFFVDSIVDTRTAHEREVLGMNEMMTYDEHLIPSTLTVEG